MRRRLLFCLVAALPAVAHAAEPNPLEQSIIDTTAVILAASQRCPGIQFDIEALDILRRQNGLPGDFMDIAGGPFKDQARAALAKEMRLFEIDPDSCAKALALYGSAIGPVPPLLTRR